MCPRAPANTEFDPLQSSSLLGYQPSHHPPRPSGPRGYPVSGHDHSCEQAALLGSPTFCLPTEEATQHRWEGGTSELSAQGAEPTPGEQLWGFQHQFCPPRGSKGREWAPGWYLPFTEAPRC